VLLRILRWGAVLFALPWIAGTGAALDAELWTFAATVTGAYAVVLALAFAPALGFPIRAMGLLVTCWGVGMAVVLLVGPLGAGPLWLATVPVLATFLFGTRGTAWGMLAVTLTVAALAVIAAGPAGLGPPDGVGPGIRYDLISWLANAGSIVGLGALLSVPFAVLLGRASRSLDREREARRALEEEAGRREALESRLREAHKLEALGTFAGGVAHDFNNLLVPLLSDAEALVAEAAPGSPARDSARRIERAAIRARELVRGILTFSRGEGGAMEHVPLGSLMEEVAGLLDASAPNGVRVTVEVDPATPALVGDPTLVHQVLVNLVMNARLALGEGGGEIRLEAWPDGGSGAVVRVSDTGVGMDEATRQRAFDPFFTTRPTGSGTGLGLSTVLGTVRSMGGEIHLDSAPGEGTKVELRFPVPDLPAPASRGRDGGRAPPISRRGRCTCSSSTTTGWCGRPRTASSFGSATRWKRSRAPARRSRPSRRPTPGRNGWTSC
jgi:signal transduction histidine kinase